MLYCLWFNPCRSKRIKGFITLNHLVTVLVNPAVWISAAWQLVQLLPTVANRVFYSSLPVKGCHGCLPACAPLLQLQETTWKMQIEHWICKLLKIKIGLDTNFYFFEMDEAILLKTFNRPQMKDCMCSEWKLEKILSAEIRLLRRMRAILTGHLAMTASWKGLLPESAGLDPVWI